MGKYIPEKPKIDYKKMHGFDNDESHETFEQWSTRIHPDDRARVLGNLNDYLARKRPGFREEYRIRRLDNRWIWVLDRAYALWDEEGRAVFDGRILRAGEVIASATLTVYLPLNDTFLDVECARDD